MLDEVDTIDGPSYVGEEQDIGIVQMKSVIATRKEMKLIVVLELTEAHHTLKLLLSSRAGYIACDAMTPLSIIILIVD